MFNFTTNPEYFQFLLIVSPLISLHWLSVIISIYSSLSLVERYENKSTFCSKVYIIQALIWFCLRNPQDWSDWWGNLVARKHQPDRLLQGELWSPQLETADWAATHKPSGRPACLSAHLSVCRYTSLSFCAPVCPFSFLFVCTALLSLSPVPLLSVSLLLPVSLSDHLCRKQGGAYRWCL